MHGVEVARTEVAEAEVDGRAVARVNPARSDSTSAGRATATMSGAALGVLASVAALLGWLLGLLLVLHLLFVAFDANPANRWTAFVTSWAPRLDLGLPALAARAHLAMGGWIGYPVAAIVWGLIGVVLSRTLRRIAARRGPAGT